MGGVHHRLYAVIILLCLMPFVFARPAEALDESPSDSLADTLAARHPQPPRAGTGERLLAIPSLILTIPVFVVENVTKGAMYLTLRTKPVRQVVEFLSHPSTPVTPLVSYSSNQGFAGGLSIKMYGLASGRDRLRLKGTYSFNEYSLIDLKYTNFELRDSRLFLILNGAYSRKPRETFFGLGNDSRETGEVAFTIERSYGRASIAGKLASGVSLGVFAGVERNNISDGDDPDRLDDLRQIRDSLRLPVRDFRSTQFYTVGGSLSWDTRDMIGQPSRGGLRTLEVSFNRGFGDFDDLEFVRTRLELSQYVDVYRKRIFAFRLLMQNVDRSDDVPPNPVYLLSSLGGPETLRSYDDNRFVDRDLALATLEYRYPVWKALDAFLFVDEGRVFRELSSDFTLRNWHYSAGIGLRAWTREAVIISAEVATGKEGTRFIFFAGSGF